MSDPNLSCFSLFTTTVEKSMALLFSALHPLWSEGKELCTETYN